MIEIEISGSRAAIEETKSELAALFQEGVQQYDHCGFAGVPRPHRTVRLA
jgi:hypothetical protein